MSSSGLETGVTGTKVTSFGRLPSAEEPVRVLAGDALTMLQSLPDGCVQCAITSPPYYGLRDNGTARWEGGDPDCTHMGPPKRTQAGFNERYHGVAYASDKQGDLAQPFRGDCPRCAAVRIDQQIGLEETPERYIERLVAVFREVRRVLRKDGTFWLNMGDSYARAAGKGQHKPGDSGKQAYVYDRGGGRASATLDLADCGMKEKDLMLMPHRLALALQADGWWVRMDCVWQKPNPMPESCRDRPTRAHEYVFLLTKAAQYYYDPVAVREGAVKGAAGSRFDTGKTGVNGMGRVSRKERESDPRFRNQRSVWTINARAYAGAHFSTFPPALVEPCLRAGTSARGCCPQCGAPWRRLATKETVLMGHSAVAGRSAAAINASGKWAGVMTGNKNLKSGPVCHMETTGWTPTCAHDDPPVPCICLDPFAGSGTVGQVALELGRRAILIELQEAYLPLIQARLAAVQTKREGME